MVQAQLAAEAPRAGESPVEPTRVLIPSPLGVLGIEFRNTTVTRLLIVPGRNDRKGYLALKEVKRSDFLDEAVGRFSEVFAGARKNPGLEFDLGASRLDDLSRRILLETTNIPYGETRTYQKLAAGLGAGDSYRLIRSVLMANPIPILVPCHRVVPRKGGVGTYLAGTKRKEWLLKLEQRVVSEQG